MILTGGPGTGKSLLARIIARHRCTLIPTDRHVPDGIVYMAPTNAISKRLSSLSDTIHATCDLPISGSRLNPMSLTGTHARHYRNLATCRTFVIDEFSLIALQDFELLLTRIAQAQDITRGHVLQQNLVLLVGDEAQMPPVCNRSCTLTADVCPRHHIAAHPDFREAYLKDATCLKLRLNHRNPGFAAALEHIRNQHNVPLTQEWVDSNINCLLDTTTALPLEGRILHSHRFQVAASNSAFLDALNGDMICTPPLIQVQGAAISSSYHTIAYNALDRDEKAFVDSHPSNTLSKVAAGVRIRLTANVNKASGATTAATGLIVGFTFSALGNLTALRVLLDDNHRTISIHRTFPVAFCRSRRYLRVSFWPLALEHASTTHCVQGASLATVLAIDLHICFAPGMAYVALSRNIDTTQILLRKPLTVEDLRVISLPKFYAASQH
jgi:hypothetical protein